MVQLMTFLTGDEWWIARVFLVVLLTVSLNYFAERLLAHLQRKVEATKTLWDDALLGAASRPLMLLIWLIGLSLAGTIAQQQSSSDLFELISPLRHLGIILLVTWFLVRAIRSAQRSYSQLAVSHGRADIDITTITALANLGKLSVIITGILVALQSMGYSVSGVLAFGGVGGIVVGFAAKDLLANLFGSLIIFLDRPFKIGDWVRSPEREIEGTVESIGWRMTVIRTFDQRPLYVPNAVFSTITIENPSRMTNRRIYETIGIRYDDFGAMQRITDEVREMLRTHPEIDTDRTLIVNFNQYGDSALNFFIYTFTKTVAWVHFHEVKQDILLRIGEIIQRHGAEIAYPTQTLHVLREPPTQ